jgi:hypothetical protein
MPSFDYLSYQINNQLHHDLNTSSPISETCQAHKALNEECFKRNFQETFELSNPASWVSSYSIG